MHVVVFKDSVAEDPKIIDTRNEVDDAKGAILVLADISQQVLASDLDPVPLDHDPDILDFFGALRVEDTVFLVNTSVLSFFLW